FRDTLWRWISGILGVICLSLIIILGILLNSWPDCRSCQEGWIGYQCKCYFVSSDSKTWAESMDFCAFHNSTLLQMDSSDELDSFLKLNKKFYWIGVHYSNEHAAWLWINGSAFPQDVFPFLETPNTENCIRYSPSNSVLDYPCSDTNRFICKQRFS
ncbi:Natural killer cells antigen CD94, partial [Galemys pyrenaicus]